MKRYGRIADLPDQRDYVFSISHEKAVPPPPTLDLRSTNYGIDDQGDLGSCTGHGSEGAFRNLLAHEKLPDWKGSRLAAYYYARSFEGTIKSDSGAQIRDAMKGIHQYGSLDESLWPYTISKFATAPTKAAVATGLKHIGLTYQSVDNTNWDTIRTALATNGNLVIGITVYQSFESDSANSTGVIPMPGKKESILGGHCMRALGYTDTALIVANSWGTSWGDKGFCYLPKAYCTNSKLSSDWWTWTKI